MVVHENKIYPSQSQSEYLGLSKFSIGKDYSNYQRLKVRIISGI